MTCFLCEDESSDTHHVAFRSLRPDLVETPSNFLSVCRNCHDRIHRHELKVTHEGNHILVRNAEHRVAIATTEVTSLFIYSARPSELGQAYAFASQQRSAAKLEQWRLAARLRAWARVMQPQRWDIEASRRCPG